MFLPFLTIYLWEAGFSLPTSTKTTYHNRLDTEADMRVQPDIIKVCTNVNQGIRLLNLFQEVVILKKLFMLTYNECINFNE